MGISFKKAIRIIKAVFLFIIENWHTLIAFIGVIISGIFAVLGLFFDFFSFIINTRVILPLWLIIVIFPFLVYAVISIVIKWIDALKKPAYLKFISMEYKHWKLKWEYESTKYHKYYNIINIHPICKKCGCKLKPHHTTIGIDGLYCPVCEENNEYPSLYRNFMETDIVETVIRHKIENNLF